MLVSLCFCLFGNSPEGADNFRLDKLPDSANRSPEKCVKMEASCGYSHFSSVFGVNTVNDHYNFVVYRSVNNQTSLFSKSNLFKSKVKRTPLISAAVFIPNCVKGQD